MNKPSKHLIGMAIIAIAILSLISCNPDPDNGTTAITRTFAITAGGHTVTVTDTRTGKNDTDLQALGIIGKLETEFNNQAHEPLVSVVLARGLTIRIEANPDYEYYKAYSGNLIGYNFGYMTSAEADFVQLVGFSTSAAFNLPDPNA